MFILNCRNDVRQKAFLSNFLIRDQMGQKAAETILNINSASGPGTTNERPVQWSGSFTKETKSLEDDHSGHQKLITTR